MLDSHQKTLLKQLLASLKDSQRIWLMGYINGLNDQLISEPASLPDKMSSLSLFYATETGNTKALGRQLEKRARALGIKVKLIALNKLKLQNLEQITHPVIFLISTHGEGDPPELAQKFFKECQSGTSAKLTKLEYAVLGLGDRAYAEFCKAARDLESILKRNHASAFYETTLFDVDYAVHTPSWIEKILNALPGPKQKGVEIVSPSPARDVHKESRGFNRLSPVKGIVKNKINLNDAGSDRETYHLEVTCEIPLAYTPGDAMGVLLPEQEVSRQVKLENMKSMQGKSGQALASSVLERAPNYQTPRLYSVASSAYKNAKEIHLTVALATHVLPDGVTGYGFYSHYLSCLEPGEEISFYIQRNLRFSLPEKEDADLIMIGAGTGIAPFRSFLQECEEQNTSRRSWLFFGNPHQHCDFLYQAEWQDWLESNFLTRIDLAFSRDQEEKIYVQHRLKENAEEILNWLEQGAYVYVCGAKFPMGEAVENTLLEIISLRHKNAKEWLENLSEQDRYVKDVY